VVRAAEDAEGAQPALVRLAEPVEHDCVLLADSPDSPDSPDRLDRRPDEVLVTAFGPGVPEPAPWTGRGAVGHGTDGRPRLRDLVLPGTAVGGAVVGLAHAAVVGVVWTGGTVRPGESAAVPVRAVRALCEGRPESAAAWSEIMRGHDRYHLRRHRDAATRAASWTAVQERLPAPAGGHDGLAPALRTTLHGLLADLEPPLAPDTVRDVLAPVDHELAETGSAGGEPWNWRDGVLLLTLHDRGLEDVVRYAAHLWTYRVGAPGVTEYEALNRLREWLEEMVRTRLGRVARQQVLDVLDTGRALAGGDILVELVLTSDGPAWHVRRARRRALRTVDVHVAPGGPGSGRSSVRGVLAAELAFSAMCGAPVRVFFVLPDRLVNAPVEDWLLTEGSTTRLGQLCAVGLVIEREPRSLRGELDDEASRRMRWAGVAAGPLRPLPVLHGAEGDPPTELLFGHLAAVPVMCGPLGVGGVLDHVVGNGYGLMIWRRDDSHTDCAEFQARAAELVRAAGSAVGLLDLIRELRARRDDPDAAWARGIAVLYDPPGAL
jgi:hypothetical protein